MNLPTNELVPVDQPTFAYSWADYSYAPGFGCHIRKTEAGDDHLLLTPMITLDKPLYEQPSNPLIHTGARGSNHQRACCWWQPWWPAPARSGVFFAYERQREETFMLVFIQSAPNGHTRPFRLIVHPLMNNGPKQEQLLKLLTQVSQSLPLIQE